MGESIAGYEGWITGRAVQHFQSLVRAAPPGADGLNKLERGRSVKRICGDEHAIQGKRLLAVESVRRADRTVGEPASIWIAKPVSIRKAAAGSHGGTVVDQVVAISG